MMGERDVTTGKLLQEILAVTRTPEFMAKVRARIEEENAHFDEYEREQRRLWNEHKDDEYTV